MQMIFTPLLTRMGEVRIAPVLCVLEAPNAREYAFQCIDPSNVVIHVETFHATLADALRQVANRMDIDKHPAGYTIEVVY